MNQYTLIFIDSNLEAMYQKQRLESTRYPLFISVSIGILIVFTSGLIELAVRNTNQGLIMKLSVITYVLLQIVLVQQRKQYTKLALFIMNHIVMLSQFTVDPSQSNGLAYLFAGSNMMVHAFIIFTSDFKEAIFSNLSLLLIRCLISDSYTPGITFQQYLYAGIICIFGWHIMYNIDKSVRTSYLLNLKDNQWEKLLPTVLKNKFFLFRFIEDSLQFQTICSNQQDQLKDFLRATQLQTQNLEQFIFQRTNLKLFWTVLENYSLQMCAKYQGRAVKMTYHEFQLEQRIYLIIFDEEEFTQRKIYQDLVRKQQNFFHNFVHQIDRVIWQGLQWKSQIQFNQLHLSLLQIQARLMIDMKAIQITEIQFGKLVQQAVKYAKQATKSSIVLNKHSFQDHSIQTYKMITFLWLVHVFKSHHGKLLIFMSNIDQGIQLRLIGQINVQHLQRDVFFQKGLKLLQINVILEDSSNVLQDIQGLVLRFNDQITASFMD